MKYYKFGHGKWVVDPKEYQDQIIHAVINMFLNDNSIMRSYGKSNGAKKGI